MTRGPKGERRPAVFIANVVKVVLIATGDELEEFGPLDDGEDRAAKSLKSSKGALTTEEVGATRVLRLSWRQGQPECIASHRIQATVRSFRGLVQSSDRKVLTG